MSNRGCLGFCVLRVVEFLKGRGEGERGVAWGWLIVKSSRVTGEGRVPFPEYRYAEERGRTE